MHLIKLVSVLTLLAVGMMFSACLAMREGVKGSGNRQSEKREIPAFTSIVTEGAFEIEVVCQKQPGLEITGDDNILPLISTVVDNNVLRIRSTRGYDVETPIQLRLTTTKLNGLSSVGAGRISVTELKNERFEIDSSGAPNIMAAGESSVVDIKTNGAGKIDTHRLRADRVIVDSKGVSKVAVFASEQLDVTVAGPSHVTYEGEPKVNKTVHGPGSVEKKESSPM